jgi:hypothetical protein
MEIEFWGSPNNLCNNQVNGKKWNSETGLDFDEGKHSGFSEEGKVAPFHGMEKTLLLEYCLVSQCQELPFKEMLILSKIYLHCSLFPSVDLN